MAGEWIKFRSALVADGRVRIAAKNLRKGNALGNASGNAHSVTVLGGMVTLWVLADQQANDEGELVGYDVHDVDELVGVPGFCESLPNDWIDLSGEWVKLPDYQEHNGATAKKRAQTAKRVANAKANATTNATTNAEGNAPSVSKPLATALPREEKRREEEKVGGQATKFTRPTLDQVRDYFTEKNANQPQVQAERFINHYTANGWKVGKNSMKDWKACVRNWLSNDTSHAGSGNGQPAKVARAPKRNW